MYLTSLLKIFKTKEQNLINVALLSSKYTNSAHDGLFPLEFYGLCNAYSITSLSARGERTVFLVNWVDVLAFHEAEEVHVLSPC